MKQYQPDTLAIRTQTTRSDQHEHSVPIFMTSSFVFDDAEHMRAAFAEEVSDNIYSRFSNPNVDELIAKMCALEHAEAGLATGTGMAAVFASMAGLLRQGDHVLASRAVFGSTHQILTQLLPRWGITHTYTDGNSVADWTDSLQQNTKMILLETPSNPGLQLVDLEEVGRFAADNGLILNVDNCFATPVIQNPLDYGAHLVTHSATKFIDGQGRAMGGLILGRKELIQEIRFFCRHTGPALSPFNAWLLSKSLETLSLRMERHASNALQIARMLESSDLVQAVRYPYLESHPDYAIARRQMRSGGGILTCELSGGLEAGKQFMDRLALCSITANLGDSRTIVTHPASSTHSKLTEAERLAVGISPGLIRISAGLEDIRDLLADIGQSLEAIKS